MRLSRGFAWCAISVSNPEPVDQDHNGTPRHRTARNQGRGCSVAPVNSRRVSSPVALAAGIAAFAMTLAACGSDTDSSTNSSASTAPSVAEVVSSSVVEAPMGAGECPTAAPQNAATPDWTLTGTTGSVAVTGSTDTAAPVVQVETPFSVAGTQVHTLRVGDGPVVAPTAEVLVCYLGVNGSDGTVFASSYERGDPVPFSLGGVEAGFRQAIAGQRVGSTVAVAMTCSPGCTGFPNWARLHTDDTLVFAIKILDVTN